MPPPPPLNGEGYNWDFGGWADVSFSSIINDDMFYTSAVCTIRAWRPCELEKVNRIFFF